MKTPARCVSLAFLATAAAFGLAASPLRAAVFTWNPSATGPTWSAASNWGGTAPGAGDVGQFTAGLYASQPSLTSTATVGGLWETGSGAITISGSALTLVGTNTINGNANTGIEMDAIAGPLTINAPLVLANNQQWINNSIAPMTVNGPVTTSYNLTKSGTGTLALTGNLTLGGTLSVGGGTLNQTAGQVQAPTATVDNGGAYNLGGTAQLQLAAYTGNLVIGNSGVGTFAQSGGTNSGYENSMYLGYSTGAAGSYNLSGTGLVSLLYGSQYLGFSGTGTFTQSGGTNALSSLELSNNANSRGTYNLSGSGVLNATIESVGSQGANNGSVGTFQQSGGTNTAVALQIETNSTYNLSGGQLLVNGGEYVNSANSTLQQSAGLNSAEYVQVYGNYLLGGGTLLLNGGLAMSIPGILSGGTAAAAISASNSICDFSQGSLVSTGSISLAIGAGSLLIVPSSGFNPGAFKSFSNVGLTHTAGTTLNLSATQGFAGWGTINDPVICQGTITATPGGSISLNNGLQMSGTAQVNLGAGALFVSDSTSGMTSGSANLNAGTIFVGAAAAGTFTQSSGTVNAEISLGDISSGTYVLSGSGDVISRIESIGPGTFTQSGGTNSVSTLIMPQSSGGGAATYNLNGGLLSVGQVFMNSGTVNFNFGGGTLAATAPLSIPLPIALTGGNGPGTFNTGGYAVTVSGSVFGPGGLTKVGPGTLTLSGSNTYNGLTSINGGVVSLGYSAALAGNGSITFDGGTLQYTASNTLDYSSRIINSSGPIQIDTNGQNVAFSGSLTGSNSAGLTKIGAGALTLAASNGYTGGTIVNGGVLQIGNSSALGASAAALAVNSGTLDVHGYNVNVGALTGSGTIDNLSGSGSLTVGNGNASSTFSGTMQNTSGQLSLIKVGTGSFGLGGNVTLAGTATVNGGTLQMPSGSLTSPLQYVGYSNTASFVQSGGNNSAASGLYLGYNTGSSGSYILSGGSLSTAGSLVVANSGSGSFVQSGGVSTISGNNALLIGGETTASGSYSLSGSGLLSLGAIALEYIGPTSVFTQTGGTHSIAGTASASLTLSGTYGLSGNGLLSVTGSTGLLTEWINPSGVFTQTGGTNAVVSDLQINGSYSLSGNAQLSAADEVFSSGSFSGSFTQTGGTNSVPGSFTPGHVGGVDIEGLGSPGTYQLKAGLLSTYNEDIGLNAGSSGSLAQSGGTNSFANLLVGGANGGIGVYILTGSAFAVGNYEGIGASYSGTGAFTQSGGTNAISGYLAVGGGTAAGTFNLSSGLLTAPSESIGSGVAAVFTQSGGANTVSGSVSLAQPAASSGTYNLNGGTLTCLQVTGGSGSGFFYFNGGMLLAGAGANSNFVSGLTSAYIQSGGAFINTNGQTVTIAQPLQDAGGGSLTKLGPGALILTGANTYAGGTTVSAGTLQIGNGGYNGSIVGNVTDNATLVYNLQDYQPLPSNITGTGNLSLIGGGDYYFSSPVSISIGGALTIGTGTDFTQETAVSAGNATNQGYYEIGSASLSLGTGTLTNYSSLDLYGASILGNVVNYYGGTIYADNGTTITGNVTNLGDISPSGVLVVSGSLTNAGIISLNNGSPLSGGALINNPTGVLRGDGVVNMALTNQGLIDANGTSGLTLVNFSGGNQAGGVIRVESGDSVQVRNGGSAIANQGTITLVGASSLLSGDPIANTGTIQGQGMVANTLLNSGILAPQGGQLLLTGAANSNSYAGTIQLPSGASLLAAQGFASNYGLIALSGGAFSNANNAIANYGSILGEGTFSSGSLSNFGTVTFSSGNSAVFGAVYNEAGATLGTYPGGGAVVAFYGHVTNAPGALITINSATTSWLGGLTNNGTYQSDPAANYFTGLTVGSSGVIQGSEGDNFFVTVPFNNAGQIDLAANSTMVVQNGGTLVQTAGRLEIGASATLAAGSVEINGGTLLADGPGATITAGLIYASPAASTYQGSLKGAGNSLLLDNPAASLVLSGSDGYTGGTYVEAGTLIVANNAAIADGTNLSVGTDLAAFGDVVSSQDSGSAAAPVAAPVPEPGTLALAATALGIAAATYAARKVNPNGKATVR